MAISTIGGAAASTGGLTTPAGSRLQLGGYTSTGSVTATIPAGDYYFLAPPSSQISCNGTTYNGWVDRANNGSGTVATVPSPNFLRVIGSQQVTVTVGASPVTTRLGDRNPSGNAQFYNRNAVRYLPGNQFYFFPDSTNNLVWYSSDGISWNSTSTTFAIGQCFMVANGILFAGDTTNTNTMYTSTNGITWTQRTMPTGTVSDGKLVAVVYSGGKYVAFFRRPSGGSFAPHTFTSTDGITWTYGASFGGAYTNADNGLFVAASSTTIVVMADGGTANLTGAYSTNGTTWSAYSTASGANRFWDGVEFVGNNFVAVVRSNASESGLIYYNTNGQSASWSLWQQPSFWMYAGGGRCTGINYDGTAWVITSRASDNNNGVQVARATSLGSGFTLTAPFGWFNSTVQFAQNVFGSYYVNNRWFFTAYDFRFGSSEIMTFISTAFPTLQSPGSFGLFRMHDTTTLN